MKEWEMENQHERRKGIFRWEVQGVSNEILIVHENEFMAMKLFFR